MVNNISQYYLNNKDIMIFIMDNYYCYCCKKKKTKIYNHKLCLFHSIKFKLNKKYKLKISKKIMNNSCYICQKIIPKNIFYFTSGNRIKHCGSDICSELAECESYDQELKTYNINYRKWILNPDKDPCFFGDYCIGCSRYLFDKNYLFSDRGHIIKYCDNEICSIIAHFRIKSINKEIII